MPQHPNIDPELAIGLEALPPSMMPKALIDFNDMPGTRARADELFAARQRSLPRNGRVTTEDRMVPGPEGAPDIRVRIYRPAGTSRALPGLYWIHGGGMVTGRLEDEDLRVKALVEQVGCVAVSVDYRLAPEHPYPAPVEDCYAALVWASERADDLGINLTLLAVGGASAGGGLAAATVLLARDRGTPNLAFQLLICPMLDDRNITPSSHEITDVGVWDRDMNISGWTALLGDKRGTDEVSPYAAPARASDLTGLPPTFIDVGSLEVFRDEDVDYALRLMRASVPTELHVYPGAYHGWDGFAPTATISQAAVAARTGALRRALLS
ncbi:MAG: alpha/beta hydrolase [Solirubrobacterales bacterium]|nr:alpha/beta hydrolase [Solirubrobacterales bacterium]